MSGTRQCDPASRSGDKTPKLPQTAKTPLELKVRVPKHMVFNGSPDACIAHPPCCISDCCNIVKG